MKFAVIAIALASVAVPAIAQETADVDAIVAAVKSKGDFKALCQSGPDAIRKNVSEVTTELARAGKLKGNPGQAGGVAGQKIGQECRG